MKKLDAKDLKNTFIETMKEVDGFENDEGNPFIFRFEKKEFIIFLKNLTSAYFKRSEDVTRIQLPFSQHFKKISNSNSTFLAIGFDVNNDVFVCWNPKNVIGRLNAKNNISLYSRESLQRTVIDDEFKIGQLSNGEKIILFKRTMLQEFFKQINYIFDLSEHINDKSIYIQEQKKDSIIVIKDDDILKLIKPLLQANKILESVEICMNHYKDIYPKISFKEWFNTVKNLYK